jgi:hypothetical protein
VWGREFIKKLVHNLAPSNLLPNHKHACTHTHTHNFFSYIFQLIWDIKSENQVWEKTCMETTVQWFPKCGLHEHFLEDPCIHFCDNGISQRKIYYSVHLSKVVQTEKKSLKSKNRCMVKHEISCKMCADVCTDSVDDTALLQ